MRRNLVNFYAWTGIIYERILCLFSYTCPSYQGSNFFPGALCICEVLAGSLNHHNHILIQIIHRARSLLLEFQNLNLPLYTRTAPSRTRQAVETILNWHSVSFAQIITTWIFACLASSKKTSSAYSGGTFLCIWIGKSANFARIDS